MPPPNYLKQFNENSIMKLLLTSGGITNDSLKQAFLELVGKLPKDIKVAFIPTAGLIDADDKGWLINDLYRIKEIGVYIDIVDIAQLSEDEWMPRVEMADVIFVGGGNSYYLSYWMQKSGLMAQLSRLLETRVYAGISAGSMVVGDNLRTSSLALSRGILEDDEYDELGPTGRSSAKTAGLVNFVIRPHLNSRFFPKITGELVEKVAKDLGVPIYAIDDQSAVKVNGKNIEIISEGEWKLYNPGKDKN